MSPQQNSDNCGHPQSEQQWQQLVLQIKSDRAEDVEEALFASGALSVSYRDLQDQPILEPAPGEVPLWDDIQIVGLYPQRQDVDAVMSVLQQLIPSEMSPSEWQVLPDQVWERSWMSDFEPQHFGADLWIVPSHCQAPEAQARNIHLDPGLAFGTGTHPTTRLCLQWLATADLHDKTLLDYGCGSGILGIAAARCGARQIFAVDIDEQALQATKNNATLNEVVELMCIGSPDVVSNTCVDVLLANILYQPLLELAPTFAALLEPGGDLVLSGLLQDQLPDIQLRYNHWFDIKENDLLADWALIHATKRG